MGPVSAFVTSAGLSSQGAAGLKRRGAWHSCDVTCATEAPTSQATPAATPAAAAAAAPAAAKPARTLDAAGGMSTPAFATAVEGEWFGYEVSFAVNDGKPMSIPERYIPDEFTNWGVGVLGFEEVTSSRVVDAKENSSSGGVGEASHLYVKRTRALPSVGCEADAVVPECRVERFVGGNDVDVAVSKYGEKGTVVPGAAVGFDDGAWSSGPATFDQDKFGRWYACIVDPAAASSRRARLEFSTVNEPRGAVVAFVETNEGPFCDGELLPGCGGKNASFAEQAAVTAAELAGKWQVETTVLACAEAEGSGEERVVSSWAEGTSSSVVERSEAEVEDEVNVLMPTGLSVGMQKSDDGGMYFRAGWLTSPTSRAVITRLYGADGMLRSVSRSLERKDES